MFAFPRRNRVEAASAPRVATQYSFESEITAIKQSVNFERLERIGRTRWFIPTRRWQQWR